MSIAAAASRISFLSTTIPSMIASVPISISIPIAIVVVIGLIAHRTLSVAEKEVRFVQFQMQMEHNQIAYRFFECRDGDTEADLEYLDARFFVLLYFDGVRERDRCRVFLCVRVRLSSFGECDIDLERDLERE